MSPNVTVLRDGVEQVGSHCDVCGQDDGFHATGCATLPPVPPRSRPHGYGPCHALCHAKDNWHWGACGWMNDEERLQKTGQWVRFSQEHLDWIARQQGTATKANGKRDGGRALIATTLADVKSEAVRWHWKGYLPVGKLCVVQGDPGVGKSMFTMYLTACLTTGKAFHGETKRGVPGDVLVISYEDSGADTLKPRATALGADMKRVHIIEGVGEDREQFTLPLDLLALRAKIEETHAALVIIDPIGAAIGGGIDSHVDASVRRMLAPLAALAEDTGCTILLVMHLGKGAKPAIHAGLGSVAFTGAARIVLAIGAAPDNPAHRILATVKNNVSQHAPSLRYFISTWSGYADEGGELVEAPCINWMGTDTATADDLIVARNEQADSRADREDARDWLHDELAKKGPCNAGELLREGVDGMGFSKRTLQRIATRDLKVQRSRDGERGPWIWALPNGNGASPNGDEASVGATNERRRPDDIYGKVAPTAESGAYGLGEDFE